MKDPLARILMIIWFVAVTAAVFVPGFILFFKASWSVMDAKDVYQLFVKETLGSMLSAVLTAIIAAAVVKAGASVFNNHIAAKNSQPVTPFKFFD